MITYIIHSIDMTDTNLFETPSCRTILNHICNCLSAKTQHTLTLGINTARCPLYSKENVQIKNAKNVSNLLLVVQ